MKLYFSKGACSLASRIIINELKLPCEFIAVDLKNKRTKSGENFFDINPKGVVPTLITDNDEVITENAVILQYLADTYQATELLPKLGNFNRYRVLEWLNFIATELHKNFSVLFKPNLAQEVKDSIFIPLIKSRLSYVNNQLAKNEYLFNNHFTLADGYLQVMLFWAYVIFKLDLSEFKNLERYYHAVNERPSVHLSLTQEHLK